MRLIVQSHNQRSIDYSRTFGLYVKAEKGGQINATKQSQNEIPREDNARKNRELL